MVLIVQKRVEFLQLQILDNAVNMPVVVQTTRAHGPGRAEARGVSTVADLGKVVHMPVVVSSTGGPHSAEYC